MATTKALELGQFGTDLTVDDSTGAVTIANDVTVNAATSTGIDDNATTTKLTISDTAISATTANFQLTGGYNFEWGNGFSNGDPAIWANTTQKKIRIGPSGNTDGEILVVGTYGIDVNGDITTTGTLKGPSLFYIDPSTYETDSDGSSAGSAAGTVRIRGDLIVDGATTTINSTTLTVDDLNIVVASGAADSATADGAGITIDGANATLTWSDSAGRMVLNKGLNVQNIIQSQRTNYAKVELNSTAQTSDNWIIENSNGKFVVTESHSGSNVGSWLYVAPGGNVGIGSVSSPNQSLVVDHIGHGVGFGYVSSIPDAPGGVYSTAGGSTYPFNEYGNLILKARTDYNVYDIIMMTASTNGNAEIRMVIKDNGKVGVGGITDPVQDFEVEGSIGTNQVRHSIRPTLNLDFANTKKLDGRIVFGRASSATYYDGRTKVKAEENLHTYSNTFTSGHWQKYYSVVTDDVATAPDGTTTASFLREDSTGSSAHILWRADITTFADVNYSLSAYVKRNGRDIQLRVAGRGAGWAWANFDLAAGTTGNSGGTNYVNSYITDVGNGWYLCEMIATSVYDSSVGFEFGLVPNPATNGEEPQYNGDGSSGVYIWNAQIEENDRATAPVFTSSNPISKYVPKLLTAGLNTPRFDHNPDTGESYGLLIEEAVTNQLGYSADLANASWTKIGTNVLSNYSIAPDGTHTADLVYATETGADKRIQKQTTVNASTTYTASVFAKAQGKRYIRMYASNLLSNTSFDLQNGTVVSQSTTGAEIIPVGNGWYRCSVSHVGVNGAGYWYTQVGDDSGVSNTDANPVNGVLFWGAQFEANPYPTSYIATSTASLTKNADLAYISFDDWYPYSEGGSFYIEAKVPSTSEDIMLLEATRGTTNVISDISITSATFGSQFISRYLSSNNDARGSGDITAGQFFKYAGSWNNTSNYTSLNGGTVNAATGNQSFRVGGDRLYIGSRYGSSLFMNDRIKKFSFYTESLSGAELKALTEE